MILCSSELIKDKPNCKPDTVYELLVWIPITFMKAFILVTSLKLIQSFQFTNTCFYPHQVNHDFQTDEFIWVNGK